MVQTYQRDARVLPVPTNKKQKRRVPRLEVLRYRGLSGGGVVTNRCGEYNVTSSYWAHVAIIRITGLLRSEVILPVANLSVQKDFELV